MSTNTSIEWTDATWNPIRGCSRVSEGCRNCYAELVAARFSGPGQAYEGLAKRHRPSRMMPGAETPCAPQWTGEVRFIEHKLDEPMHWREPKMVFVNSMSDLFHEKVQYEWIDRIFAVMALCPQHTFQILTKRPERMLEYCRTLGRHHETDRVSLAMKKMPTAKGAFYTLGPGGWHFKNVWLGVSVEDQQTADERIPLLLQTPAAIRWVSYEPALGPVDFRRIQYDRTVEIDALTGDHGVNRPLAGRSDNRLNWIVAGGESGPGARPAHPDWFRGVRDQCAAAGVHFFFKQWGEYVYDHQWPPATCLTAPSTLIKAGKKRAGALLDGREHKEYPASPQVAA